MTTYLVTTFEDDPDAGTSQVVDGDKLDDVFADFRTNPATPDGAAMIVRKADYLDSYQQAVAYIAEAGDDRDERRRRKSEVFRIIYGNDALRAAHNPKVTAMQLTRVDGAVTGRMVMHRPTLTEVRRSY